MLKLQQIMMAMRRMSAELELSHSQFGELTDLIGIASIIVDSASNILSINEMAAGLLGFKPDELQGTVLLQLVANDPSEFKQILMFPLRSGKLKAFDILLTGRNGRKTALSIVPQLLDHTDGVCRSMLLVLTDNSIRSALLQTLDRSEPQLQQFSNRLIAAHELELKRVSSELHDEIGQVLAMIKFMIEDATVQLTSGDQDEACRIMNDTVARLREAMNQVRRISVELRPSSLEDLGLIPTLQWHCRIYRNAYRSAQLSLDFNVIEAEVPAALKLTIFRIVQEALNNVAKHADASEVAVSLKVEHANLRLVVRDNGKGFDVNLFNSPFAISWGVGLKSMRERVEASAGKFWIESTQGDGTKVEASWLLQAVVLAGL